MALADLADEIAIRENETAITDVPADEVKQIYMSLYYTHIPKLVEADLVSYQQERDTVTFTERAERIEQYQDFSQSTEAHCLGQAVAGAVIDLTTR